MRTLLFRGIGSLFLLTSISCTQSEPEPEPDLACISGRILGQSCNGTLIQLIGGTALGNTITYADTVREHVIGTYSELPTGLKPGDAFTFSLRQPTKQEAAPRVCLAIYSSFDVPQLILETPRCQK